MNKFALLGGLAVAVAASTIVTLETAGRTAGANPVSASQHFSCADLSGTVTTKGAEPDIRCLTTGDSAKLDVTAQATPAPTATPGRSTTTIRSSEGSANVNVSSSSNTQSSSSGTVIIEQNSQSSSTHGNASNTNRSTTNVTITNH
jgi:hypothetical protein